MKRLSVGWGARLPGGSCGSTTGERAASGGLLGAGAGAAIGSLAGNCRVPAPSIGGLTGAVVGGATDPCKFSLGDPIWRDKHASREDYYKRCGHYPR